MSFNNTGIIFLQDGDIKHGKIMTTDKVFVMVQGDFCHFCNEAKPAFIEASKKPFKHKVVFATIKSDGDASEKAVSAQIKKIDPSLSGVPAYLLFNKGKYVTTYKGNRDAESIHKFLSSN